MVARDGIPLFATPHKFHSVTCSSIPEECSDLQPPECLESGHAGLVESAVCTPHRRPSGSKILINQRLDRLAHEHVDSARMGCILAKQRAILIRRWTDETRRPKILSRTDAW